MKSRAAQSECARLASERTLGAATTIFEKRWANRKNIRCNFNKMTCKSETHPIKKISDIIRASNSGRPL